MTMKKQKTLHRFAAVAAVLLAFCLVFMMPVGAATTLPAAVDGVITLTEDVQLAETWTIGEGQTFVLNLNGKTITSSVTAIENSGTLTINGPGTIDVSGATAEATRVVMNCGDLTLNGGTYKGTEALYSYAINNNPGTLEANNAEVIGGFGGIGITSGSNAEINGGTYTLTGTEGGHLIYIKDSSKLVINDGTFKGDKETSKASDYLILINQPSGASVVINGGTFKKFMMMHGNPNKPVNDLTNVTIKGGTFGVSPMCYGTVDTGNYNIVENTDETYSVKYKWVAQIGETKYETLDSAVAAANADANCDTIEILQDVTLPKHLEISKSVTIDGKKSDTENHKISTSESQNLIKVMNYGDSEIEVTIQNVNLESTYTGAARIINVLNDNIKLNLNNALLDASTTGTAGYYTQVLNCGHSGNSNSDSSYKNIKFNLDTVKIEAPTGGYAIFSVNPFILDIKNSEISGYTALYFKTIGTLSAKGAQVTIADSTLTSTNNKQYVEGEKNPNAFGTMVFEATDVSVTLESGTTLEAESTDGYCRQAIFHFNENGYSDVSDGWYEIELIPGNTHVTVNNGVTLLTKGPNANIEQTGHGEDPLTIDDINKFMSFENGVITNTDTLSAFLGNEQILESTADSMYKVVAKTYELTATTTKVGFDSVKVGYTQPEPQPVTIKNAGNVPVTLVKPTYENFDVIDFPTDTIAVDGEATFKIQPKAGLAVGNYGTTLDVTNTNNEKATFEVSFLVYQPSSGGSSKPVEEPEEPVVEPEVPTEEPEAGEATVETEVTDGGEVEFEAPVEEPEAGEGETPAAEDEAKITGVVLPTGTEGKVEFVPISEQAAPEGKETQTKKVFEINVPTYEKGKPATIKFTMTVAELAADGKEAADVALWHFDEETGEWTKLVTSYTIVDGIVYFEAITNDFSPFAIVYEDEPVNEPVEEPETPASPAPVLGLIAALGAAVVLRRK